MNILISEKKLTAVIDFIACGFMLVLVKCSVSRPPSSTQLYTKEKQLVELRKGS